MPTACHKIFNIVCTCKLENGCMRVYVCRSLLLAKGLWIMGDLEEFFRLFAKEASQTLRVLVRNADSF